MICNQTVRARSESTKKRIEEIEAECVWKRAKTKELEDVAEHRLGIETERKQELFSALCRLCV